MNLTNIATSAGGATTPATGQYVVGTQVANPPLRFFRRVVYLRFVVGEMVDRFTIDKQATVLKAAFQTYTYNVVDNGSPDPAASIGPSGGAVIVKLNAPRQLRLINVGSGQAAGTAYSLDLFRLDGNTLPPQPTVTVPVQNGVATLPADPGNPQSFTDMQFALRLKKNADQSAATLDASKITSIQVQSYPTGARIGIADPAKLDAATFFWHVPGEIGKAVPSAQGVIDSTVDQKHAFATELERYLNTALDAQLESYREAVKQGITPDPTPPTAIDVALVIESDAPCLLNIAGFNIGYRRQLSSFPKYDEKQVLRFPGKQATTQAVSIKLPRSAVVTSATLKTSESFRSDRLATGITQPDMPLSQRAGIYAGMERWVAQSFTPPQAIEASGIALGCMPLVNKTELSVELQEDWRDQPSGKQLVAGKITLEPAGQAVWATLLFPQPVVLPSQPAWLIVKALSGRAVWLANTGTTQVHLLERSDEQSPWSLLNVLEAVQPLYALISRNDQAQAQPAVTLAIGKTTVEVGADQNPGSYNLAPALSAYIAGQPADSPVTLSMAFTSGLPGLITVYPPLIEYDLQ